MKVLGIFSLLLVTSVEGVTTPQSRADSDIRTLELEVAKFRLIAKMLPPTHEGLRSLVERPTVLGSDVRWEQSIHKLPVDPWGNPYCYIAGDGFRKGFGIYSRGEDGQSLTQGNDADDINSWRDNSAAKPEPWVAWVLTACAIGPIVGFTLGRLSARKSSATEQFAAGNRL